MSKYIIKARSTNGVDITTVYSWNFNADRLIDAWKQWKDTVAPGWINYQIKEIAKNNTVFPSIAGKAESVDKYISKFVTMDSKMKDETIRTPRGTFILTEKTEEDLKKEGYGYHHSSEDGRYKIYVKNNQAVAVRATDSKVKDTNFSSRLKLYADTFYATDFKDGNDAKRWWVNEFKRASNMKSKELKEWAEDMLDYTKDISVPYIKEDTTNLLKDIVKGKITDSLKTFKVNGKVVKAKDEFDAIKKYKAKDSKK